MHRNLLTISSSVLALVGIVLFEAAHATAIPVDAVSGASGGRKTVTVSAIDVTESAARISYAEAERNGSLRFYYSTTAFANAADTTRATVAKMTVSSRGSGTLSLSNLTAGTKYYYRFQGYYPKGTSNYWATGSLTALGSTSVLRSRIPTSGASAPTHDVLGRGRGDASGIAVGSDRSELGLRR